MITGSLLAALAVILGAFGAHSLKKILPPESLSIFETGVRYQFYHCFALLIAGMSISGSGSRCLKLAGYFFIIGIILFSGSLYMLAYLQASHVVGLSSIGILTPIGGVFFIAGWIALATAYIKNKQL